MNNDFKMIELKLTDEPFLWDMLYESIYIDPKESPVSRDILQSPDIAKYVKNWGQRGDFGYKVFNGNLNISVGAIWVRKFTKENAGYGFVNEQTPELAMAIIPQYRNQGLGTLLLGHLSSQLAKQDIKSVSLSVSIDNPAFKLYKRVGFKETGIEVEGSITMIYSLI